jgi:hypothetical protein
MSKVLLLLIALMMPLMVSASVYSDSSGLMQVIDTAADPPDVLSGEPEIAVIDSGQLPNSAIDTKKPADTGGLAGVKPRCVAVPEVAALAGSALYATQLMT